MGICSKNLVEAFVIMLAPMNFGAIIMYPSPTRQQILAEHNLSENNIQWSFYNSVSSLFAFTGPFFSRFLLYVFKGSRKKSLAVLDTDIERYPPNLILGLIQQKCGITPAALHSMGDRLTSFVENNK